MLGEDCDVPQRMDMEGELKSLDPKQVRLEWDQFGYLKAIIEGKGEYRKVKVFRSFPLSDPHRFITFRDQGNQEIGVLEDAGSLDRTSRRVLEAELEKSYVIPRITQINDIHDDSGVPTWDVHTDRGPREFELRTRQDAQSLGRGRILIKDIDGNKYEIPNCYKLDPRSQALLEEEI